MANTKTILIVGGSGFLGTHLAMKLRQGYKVFATFHKHPIKIPGVGFYPMDLWSENWVKRLIYTLKPEVVIFVAGSNSVEAAHANQREADGVHASGPALVSKTAEIFAPRFIFLSNCYTFDGSRGNYQENDIVIPTTNLGKAKVSGENFIRGKCLNYVIIRGSPLFGRGNGRNFNFMDRLRMKLDRQERMELDDNDLHSYISVHSMVDLIEKAVSSGVRNRVLHLGGLTKLTLFEFAQEFAKSFGYDPMLILPKRAAYRSSQNAEFPVVDFSLNSSKSVELLKIQPLLLQESFDLIKKNLVTPS